MAKSKTTQQPQATPIVDVALRGLGEKIGKLDSAVTEIRNESKNVIIGVLIALVLIVATVAIEVVMAHSRADSTTDSYYRDLVKEIERVKAHQEKTNLDYLDLQKLHQKQVGEYEQRIRELEEAVFRLKKTKGK